MLKDSIFGRALVYAAIMALTIVFCFWADKCTPKLDTSKLPVNIQQQQYSISTQEYRAVDGGFELNIKGPFSMPVALTLADMEPFTLYINGIDVYTYSSEDVYQRVQTVSLPSKETEKQNITLYFEMDSWGPQTQDLLSGGSLIPAKVLIGGGELSQLNSARAFGFSLFALGMLVLVIVSSMTLYFGKSSERYLLTLSFVSAVTLAMLLLTLNIPILPITHGQYALLRPLTAILPVISNAAFCCYFLQETTPRFVRRLLNVRAILLITGLAVLLRILMAYSFYNMLRWLLLLPVAYTIIGAMQKRLRGAFLLAVGYGISEAMVVFVFLVNTLQIGSAGQFMIYVHLIQFSFLISTLFGVLAINLRFADKFQDAQDYSQSLVEINTNLDSLVTERTRELEQEQKRRHALMQNVFHDLRSPLFIVKGCLEQLRVEESEMGMKATMENKLDMLERLTTDLFLTAKLEKGSMLFNEDDVFLSELLKKLIGDYQIEAKKRGVALSGEIPGSYAVWGDSVRLQQAFQNLIDNALEHTPPSGRIAVKLTRDKDMLLVSISDTGKGIAPEDISKVFQRYYRSKTSSHKSSGLGLSIAYEIVQHHKGTISVTSELGQGTTFLVALPELV